MTKAFISYLIGSFIVISICLAVKVLVYKYFHPALESMTYFFYYVGIHMLAAIGVWYLIKDVICEKLEKHLPTQGKVEDNQVLGELNAGN